MKLVSAKPQPAAEPRTLTMQAMVLQQPGERLVPVERPDRNRPIGKFGFA